MSGNEYSGDKTINEKIRIGQIRALTNTELLNVLERMHTHPQEYPLEMKIKILIPLAMKFMPDKIEFDVNHHLNENQMVQLMEQLKRVAISSRPAIA